MDLFGEAADQPACTRHQTLVWYHRPYAPRIGHTIAEMDVNTSMYVHELKQYYIIPLYCSYFVDASLLDPSITTCAQRADRTTTEVPLTSLLEGVTRKV